MCTICGHFARDKKRPSNDLYDMLKKMEHRGPDTHGVYLDGHVLQSDHLEELADILKIESHIALGHSRLKIVGKENTTQPFT